MEYSAKSLNNLKLKNYVPPKIVKLPVVRLKEYTQLRADLAFSTTVLEGVVCTYQQVASVLDRVYTEDITKETIDYVIATTEAADFLIESVQMGYSYHTSLKTFNKYLSQHDTFANGYFRGEYPNLNSEGTVNLGVGSSYFKGAPQSEVLGLVSQILDGSLAMEPFSRALNLAAILPYYQVFFDGNKRSALFLANKVLMEAGYSSIIIPTHRKDDYNTALREMFTTNKISAYSDFLRSCYIDN